MKRTILFMLIGLPALLFSQGKTWTLEDCIEYAFEHNPQRTRQEAQNEIYKINRKEAVGGFLPSLSAQTGAETNFGRNFDPNTNNYTDANTFRNTYEISTSMTLFDGLSQHYRAKMANINRLKGKDELQDIKDWIVFDVMETFFNVLYYQGTAALAKQQLEDSGNQLKRIQRMEELGLKSIPDVSEIQAKEAEDRFLFTKQTNLYRLEIIKLKAKMHLPENEEFSVSDYNATHPIALQPESARDIYQHALQTLPKVLVSEKNVSATKMEYKMIRGRLFPTLSLGARMYTDFSRYMDDKPYSSFEFQFINRRGTSINLSLSIPVFDGFSRSSEVKRSKQRLVIAQSRHEETLRQVYSEIEQVVADVDGLADECVHAQKRTAAMQNAHAVNLRKYEEGLITALELSTSANRLLNARVEEIHIQLNYQLKYRLLQYYKGN